MFQTGEDSVCNLYESNVSQSIESRDKGESPKMVRLPTLGVQARKRKAKSSRLDDELREYMEMTQELQVDEQRRLE